LTIPNHNKSKAALVKDDLRGILLPVTTPFDANGGLDLDGLSLNIKKWNGTGILGYVLLGSTGEYVHLDETERLSVISTARSAALDQSRFIAGAGQQSTRGTVNEIKRVAKAVAVDAFLVITPHFYRPSISQQALITHYQNIADASPAPVILYSMPALTGIKIEPTTAARLSEHENIIGIKDSSNDLNGLGETIKLVRKDFAVLTGNGTVFSQALTAGACGGILAVGCVAPALCLAIAGAVQSGDAQTAERLQAKLSPLAEAVTVRYGIGGLKAALDMNLYRGGTVRAPLREPDNEAREEIRRCLAEAEADPIDAQPRALASDDVSTTSR
jgi:4-hydroxy-2-oxoglutarate aldolase